MPVNPSQSLRDSYCYVYSCELDAEVELKICDFEGYYRDPLNPTRKLNQIFVQVELFCNQKPVGFPVSTSYQQSSSSQLLPHLKQNFSEWLTLPARYSALSRDAFVHFTIWDIDLEDNTPFLSVERNRDNISKGHTSFPKRLIAQASMPLFNNMGVYQSGIVDVQLSQSNKSEPLMKPNDSWKYSSEAGFQHFHEILQRKVSILRTDTDYWLNKFSAETIEKNQSKLKSDSKSLFLVVSMANCVFDLQRFDIVYYERENSTKLSSYRNPADPELGVGFENLCEAQHYLMTRHARAGRMDKQLKPNKAAKDKLDHIMKLPSTQPLTREQMDFVWKFRYHLQSYPCALNKFLHSVDWKRPGEVENAVSLLKSWAPIEAEDALELLSINFTHKSVRSYAVSRLDQGATSEQILLYLPQLVQAMKYEQYPQRNIIEDETAVSIDAVEVLEKIDEDEITSPETDNLAYFLMKSAVNNHKIANFLYWYLKVEEEATKDSDSNISQMYNRLSQRLLEELDKKETKELSLSLKAQQHFVDDLIVITEEAKKRSGRRDIRESSLRTLLSQANHLTKLNNLILPLDPTVKLIGVLPDSAQLFKSAMVPVKLTFKTTDATGGRPQEYTLIFKQGDDLRQDQLIIQMIRLMDLLFKKYNLDLKLTPYAVLSTGLKHGLVQFVKGRTLREIIKKYEEHKEQSIKEAMKEYRPDAKSPLGIESTVVDNYVRSLAGYSIVCYVLGIGDRHLDNILLCENGKLFHIDFGFILGRDPKPLPPPMKLTTEMMNPLGGIQSKQFQDFYMYCDTAYAILRKHSKVLLNLFSLMIDAGIPDIAVEKEKAVFKIEQRLKLEMSDEEATGHLTRVIDSSISAKLHIVSDVIHDWKQHWAW
ncbi:unnamed protein product [Auanema sp. JU1783]|nr:unnamed protein product [Auanema sp. JU1783]